MVNLYQILGLHDSAENTDQMGGPALLARNQNVGVPTERVFLAVEKSPAEA